MMRRFLLSLLLGLGSLAGAQSIPLLPRVPVADSSLFLCTDSTKTVTRACKFSLIQQRMALKAFDSLLTTKLKLTGATIVGSPTWSSTFTAAAGQRVDSATGAARASGLVGSPAITVSSCTGCGGGGGATVSDTVRAVTFDSVRTTRLRADTLRSKAGASQRLVVQTTTSGSALTTAVRFNEVQQSIHAAGTAANPAITASDTTAGLYRAAANSIGFSTAATGRWTIGSGGFIDPVADNTYDIGTYSGTLAPRYIKSNNFKIGHGGSVLTKNDSAVTIYQAAGLNGVGTAAMGFRFNSPGSSTFNAIISGPDSALMIMAGVNDTILKIDGNASVGTTLRGATGPMTITSGTGNSRRLALQTTTSGGTATTALRFNELQQTLHVDGTSSNPSIGFASDTAFGLYRAASNDVRMTQAGNIVTQFYRNGSGTIGLRVPAGDGTHASFSFLAPDTTTGLALWGKDTLAILTQNLSSLRVLGGSSATLLGGAGSMTIQAGTGNSRRLTLQTTTNRPSHSRAVRPPARAAAARPR